MSNAEFADFEISLDLTEVPTMSGEFSLIPAGEYVFEVQNLQQKTSNATSSPMIVMQAAVVEAIDVPGHENPDSLVGQRAWNNYSLLPQAVGRLKSLAVACGAGLGQFRASEYIGARFRGTITHTQGTAKVGPDGQPLPAKVFANIVNERPVEEAAPAPAPAATPPIAKGKAPAAKPAATGAARRA